MEVRPLRSRETLVALVVTMVLLQFVSGYAASNAICMTNLASTAIEQKLPTEEKDVSILIYVDSDSAVDSSSISDLVESLNATFRSVTIVDNPSGIVDPDTMKALYDAVIFFGSSKNITQSGAEDKLHQILEGGGGIIIAGTSGEAGINQNLNIFLADYGLEIGTQEAKSDASLVPDPYILVRDFAPAYLPFMENVTQIVYHGTNVSLDSTQHETEGEMEILFSYPLCFSDDETFAATRETLGTVTELSGGGRLVTLGSSFMFNNTVIRTADEENAQEVRLSGYQNEVNVTHLDNWLFIKNIVGWVSDVTGNMRFSNPTIEGFHTIRRQDHVFNSTKIGEEIRGTINLTTWENMSISHVTVKLYILILESELRSSILKETNPNKFTGSLSTKDIGEDRGWATAGFEARAIGYGRILFENTDMGRFWIEPVPMSATPASLSIMVVLAAGTLVFLLTAAFIWKSLREMEAALEE